MIDTDLNLIWNIRYSLLRWCFVIIFTVIGFATFVFMHESVHGAICTHSNGTPNIGFNFERFAGYAQCANGDNPQWAIELNMWNEIIGYPMLWLFSIWCFWQIGKSTKEMMKEIDEVDELIDGV